MIQGYTFGNFTVPDEVIKPVPFIQWNKQTFTFETVNYSISFPLHYDVDLQTPDEPRIFTLRDVYHIYVSEFPNSSAPFKKHVEAEMKRNKNKTISDAHFALVCRGFKKFHSCAFSMMYNFFYNPTICTAGDIVYITYILKSLFNIFGRFRLTQDISSERDVEYTTRDISQLVYQCSYNDVHSTTDVGITIDAETDIGTESEISAPVAVVDDEQISFGRNLCVEQGKDIEESTSIEADITKVCPKPSRRFRSTMMTGLESRNSGKLRLTPTSISREKPPNP